VKTPQRSTEWQLEGVRAVGGAVLRHQVLRRRRWLRLQRLGPLCSV